MKNQNNNKTEITEYTDSFLVSMAMSPKKTVDGHIKRDIMKEMEKRGLKTLEQIADDEFKKLNNMQLAEKYHMSSETFMMERKRRFPNDYTR